MASQAVKVVAAGAILLCAGALLAWQYWPASQMPGKNDPYAVWCPKCNASSSITKQKMVADGVPDPEGGGWKMPCPACKAEAFVRPEGATMPQAAAR